MKRGILQMVDLFLYLTSFLFRFFILIAVLYVMALGKIDYWIMNLITVLGFCYLIYPMIQKGIEKELEK